jgi:hypothetical protein
MFFFRHDDGTWCTFPPGTPLPTLNALRYAA